MDRAAALLRRAQAKACTHQSRLTWIQGNLASLPLGSQSFKGALALLALGFIEARLPVLREPGRVVRSRGFRSAWELYPGPPPFWRRRPENRQL